MRNLTKCLVAMIVCVSVSFAAEEKKDSLKADSDVKTVDTKTIKVTCSSFEQKIHGGWGDMPPEFSLDGDLKTAWMAEGDGEWIRYDLGKVEVLKAVKLAFARGNERFYTIDILVSETGKDDSWTTVHKTVKNSGKSLKPEAFELKNAKARYVKVVGHGNTSEKFPKWCNITEAVFVLE